MHEESDDLEEEAGYLGRLSGHEIRFLPRHLARTLVVLTCDNRAADALHFTRTARTQGLRKSDGFRNS
jgi:hypothetical protein